VKNVRILCEMQTEERDEEYLEDKIKEWKGDDERYMFCLWY
jgi:hypothetical protein